MINTILIIGIPNIFLSESCKVLKLKSYKTMPLVDSLYSQSPTKKFSRFVARGTSTQMNLFV